MRKLVVVLVALLAFMPSVARAQADGAQVIAAQADGADGSGDAYADDAQVYRIVDTEGAYLTSRAGRVYVQDEYIAQDDRLYRVVEVNGDALSATAELIGYEPVNDAAAFALFEAARAAPKKLVSMYSTHSDESYVPTDGSASKTKDAGIYDVGDALKAQLEARGIEVVYSDETFLPHDAGAYRRSRATAEELLKGGPAALLDLHRDGIPDPDEYAKKIDGENATKVRLLVGKSNANASANRAFAKEIKASADKKYPGLIKDIYVGKGNYNQELYPKSLLLEFGTHTLSKERAIQSTEYMADVLNDVLFGGTAAAATTGQAEGKASGSGIAWLVGGVVVAIIVYVLASTGTFKGMGGKIARSASEVSGGLVGKKPDDKDRG
ncbi:MAG: stage II sporulation protein P [Clostridia bacterium]